MDPHTSTNHYIGPHTFDYLFVFLILACFQRLRAQFYYGSHLVVMGPRYITFIRLSLACTDQHKPKIQDSGLSFTLYSTIISLDILRWDYIELLKLNF